MGSLLYPEGKYLSGIRHRKNLPHASRLSTSVNDDNIEKVKKIVLENRRVGIREVAEAVKISYGSTQHIFFNVLGMKRDAARLVPKDLNFLKKELRVEFAKEMLAYVADDPTFIKRIITGDVMWVYDSAVRARSGKRAICRLRP